MEGFEEPDLIAEAQRKADQILREAQLKAEQILKQAAEKTSAPAVVQRKLSDQFKTPDRPTSTFKSPASSRECLEESQGSNSSGKSPLSQFGLEKFFGSPKEQAEARPVLERKILGKERKRSIRELELDELKQQYVKRLKAVEDLEAEKAIVPSAVELGKLGGRPHVEEYSTAGLKSNRRRAGMPSKRKEFSVVEKVKIAEDLEHMQKESSNSRELFKKGRSRYGLDTRTLKHLMSKKKEFEGQRSKLKTKRGRVVGSRFVRAKGAGRKLEFQKEIDKVKEMVSKERSNGVVLAKGDLLDEFLAQLISSAQECLKQAELSKSEGQKKSWNLEAKACFARRDKLLASKKYRQSFSSRLLEYCGAKEVGKELVSPLSALEEKTRVQLSWQAIDRMVWLAGAAPEADLLKSDLFAEPKDVLKPGVRELLTIGFSDQVPLWAKAESSKMVASSEELSGITVADRKQFDLFRKDLLQAVDFFKPEDASSQVVTLEGTEKFAGGRRIAGSLTAKGVAENSKFRITYEARQRIVGLPVGSDGVRGEVAAGLLVFPGVHARLSNLDSNGRWIKSEEFEVAGCKIVHKAGEASKALKWAVDLRKEAPELFEGKLDIMSQPSCNLDSVLLKWVIEDQIEKEPLAVWIRDSFAAIFSEEIRETQALGNQLSAILLGKTTQRLQLTDTDFARAFKADFRKALAEKRSSHRLEGKEGTFKISYRTVIEATLQAQEAAVKRNLETSWVIRGAFRNALVIYRPDFNNGTLQPLEAKDCGLEQLELGSHRIPSEWLVPRKGWLQAGIPMAPEFSLSQAATNVQNLLDWAAYTNPALEDEEENPLDIDDSIEESLGFGLKNSLFLRLHPKVRKAAFLAQKDAKFSEVLEKSKEKAARLQQRASLRPGLLKALREKLKGMSKKEAIEQVVAKSNASKKKISAIFKPGAKTKPSIFKKAALKSLKKSKAKQEADKSIPAALKDLKKKTELDAVVEASGETVHCRIVSESEGKGKYGKEGMVEVKSLEKDGGEFCQLIGDKHTVVTCKVSSLLVKQDTWLPVKEWQPFSKLSRKSKGEALYMIGLKPEPFASAGDDLMDLPSQDENFDSQHMLLGFELLRWQFKDYLKEVAFIDPYLTTMYLRDEDVPQRELLKKTIQDFGESDSRVLLCPIWSAKTICHWTLLTAERVEGKWSFRYRDTLADPVEDSLKKACSIASLLQKEEVSLKIYNSFQQVGSTCGLWTLAYMMEEACSLFEGLASRGHPNINFLRMKFVAWWHQLSAEKQKLEESKKELEEKAEKISVQQEKAKEKALQQLSKLKSHTSAAAIKAQQMLEANSKYFKLQQLSEASRYKIEGTLSKGNICSKCRWNSGCLECHPGKALKYYWSKEAHSKSLVPGPDLPKNWEHLSGQGGGEEANTSQQSTHTMKKTSKSIKSQWKSPNFQ